VRSLLSQYEFLVMESLEDFEDKLIQLGVVTPSDLKDVDAADLAGVGMSGQEIDTTQKALARLLDGIERSQLM
jgi:hypothetical protein